MFNPRTTEEIMDQPPRTTTDPSPRSNSHHTLDPKILWSSQRTLLCPCSHCCCLSHMHVSNEAPFAEQELLEKLVIAPSANLDSRGPNLSPTGCIIAVDEAGCLLCARTPSHVAASQLRQCSSQHLTKTLPYCMLVFLLLKIKT